MSGREKLILAVKSHPILYTDQSGGGAVSKDKAWEIVSKITADPEGIPACKKKWRSLRDSYRKYLRSEILGPNHSNHALYRYKRWQWAPLMEFMREPCKSVKVVDPFQHSNQSWYDLPDDSFTNSEDDTVLEPQSKIDVQSINKPREEAITGSSSELAGNGTEDEAITGSNSLLPENVKENETEFMMDTNFEEAILPPAPVSCPKNTLRTNSEQMSSTSFAFTPQEDVDFIFVGFAKTVKKFSPKRQARVKFNISKLLMKEELAQLEEHEQDNRRQSGLPPVRKKKRRPSTSSSDS